jgi:hypothetical protein
MFCGSGGGDKMRVLVGVYHTIRGYFSCIE